MQQLEIEVKFYVPKLAKIRAALLQSGAQSSGRAFENNLRFENQDMHLAQNGAMLRLRQTQGRSIITVKQHVDHEAGRTCKVFKEYETEVADFDTARKIFGILGYIPFQIYEKFRETITLPDAKICLDETPYGNFVEIEADVDVIKHYTKMLELNWGHRIVLSYLEIFNMLQAQASLPFATLTFDNFASLNPKVTAESILPQLYATAPCA